MTRPTIAIPHWTLRTLHSEFVGWITDLDPVLRDAFIARTEGLKYEHFALAVLAERYTISRREQDGEVLIGLCIPSASASSRPLFEVPGRRAGVDADYLISADLLDLDHELAEILRGADD